MYAVIETGGKQYKIAQGDVIYVEKLDVPENSEVEFKVVAFGQGSELKFGNPYLDSAKVTGTVVKNGRAKKITVETYKPKKSCKRKLGHRQHYSKVEIKNLELS